MNIPYLTSMMKMGFAKYQPLLVCINLGTNDLSTKNYDIQLYEKNYRMFIKRYVASILMQRL